MSTPTPAFRDIAKRPRWLGVLALCLLVAAVFALLGQWQIDRAVEQGQSDDRDTESAVPLQSVAVAGEPMVSDAGGRMVTVTADDVAADYRTLAGRNQDGRDGWWVIGRALVEEPDGREASLAVALSWSATEERAEAAVEALRADAETVGAGQLGGRYMPSEAPTQGDVREGEREAMSVAALINQWQDWNGLVYAGYLILDPTVVAEGGTSVPGDEPIVNARPVTDTQLNWLNIFYAIEWIAFMLFAFYLWYRLVKDALEREVEAIEDAELAAAAAGGETVADEPRR